MLKNYLLVALRTIRRNKVFSFINILGLTLGLTCSLAIFMLVRHELSYDNFHQHPNQIYRVVSEFHYPDGIEYQSGVPYPLPDAFREDFPSIPATTIMGERNNQITISDGHSSQSPAKFREEEGIFYTDAAFFGIFSFPWLYGNPQEVLSRPGTIALTKATAEKYFGSWQNAIGKTLLKDNTELLTVQGILDNPPANTEFPLKEVISLVSIRERIASRQWGDVASLHQCFIRLPENMDAGNFARQVTAFGKKHDKNKEDFFSLQPLEDIHFNARYGNFGRRTTSRETLLTLSLIGVLLLILGCINFINLATAQAINRYREVGIRKVLGSLRWQLVLQFMGETALLVFLSALLSIGVLALLAPLENRVLSWDVSLQPLHSSVALTALLLIALLVTFISGLYPALILSGSRPISALKNKTSQSSPGGGFSLRRILVVTQFVIAQVLIVGVLVAIDQMNYFRHAPLGFDKDAILVVNLPKDSSGRSHWESFREEVLRQAGVENVSFSYMPPSGKSNNLTTFGFNQQVKQEGFEVNFKAADTGYFSTYGIHFLAGRPYRASDTASEYVVNETLLRKEGIQDPHKALGKYIYLDGNGGPIVGVVADFHEHSLRDPIEPALLATNLKRYTMAGIRLRTEDAPATVQRIEKIFSQYFPDYIFEHQYLSETIARYYDQEEKLSAIFKLFAGIALLISCLGLYGLILFATAQRIREVGIRKVLGASVANISFLFIREFCVLIGIAFLIATPIAWYSMNSWLNNFAYRVQISPWIFVITGMLALLIGMATISYRTVRTALSNPVKNLRSE